MERNTPFFSIIVPVYNTKKFLTFCVGSVLAQTFKDFELILVDDGSTDGSSQLCDSFVSKDLPKVRVFHKANEGVVLARCFGAERAFGEFVLFLDSDDGLRFDALEVLHNTIVSFCADLVLFGFSTDEAFAERYRDDISLASNRLIPKESLYKEFFNRSINNICGKTFKRGIAPSKEELGDFVNVKIGEDIIQSGFVIGKAENVVYLDETLYFYRQHEESVMHSYNPKALFYSCRIAKFFDEYLESLSLDNDTKREFQEIIDLSSVYDCCVSIASIVRKAGRIDVIPSEISYLYDAYRRCNKTKVKTVQRIEFFLFKRKCYAILLGLLKVWDGLKCKKV